MAAKAPLKRCAIYTRKSSEEGLEQDFNSLDAQREACEAFIRSQKGEGWQLIATAYDDGGYSGGTMERPGLQKLLGDLRAGKIDIVVVYKVDRLTRSLGDFAKMVEDFDRQGASFVAVTQQFNTTTSMGRLTLNILLSFAQFEREVTGERIRDKIAASKKKGMWMGGNVPLGYDVKDRKLVVNRAEAATVRMIFEKYAELGSVLLLKADLDRRGVVSKLRNTPSGENCGGCRFSRGALYTLLSNPVYIGKIRHKEVEHAGQHEAIIDWQLWDKAAQQLKENRGTRRDRPKSRASSFLIGKLFDETCEPLVMSHTVKNGRRYQYFVSRRLLTGKSADTGRGWRLPASEAEACVRNAIRQWLQDEGEIIGNASRAAKGLATPKLLRAVRKSREMLADAGASAALLQDLVRKVTISDDRLDLEICLSALLRNVLPRESETFLVLKRSVPLQMKRRGVETRLVIEGGGPQTRPLDLPLLKAVARAHHWFDELRTERAKSMHEIARRDGVTKAYVARLIPLAFLAPTTVEAIVNGTQPIELNAEALTRRGGVSSLWEWHS